MATAASSPRCERPSWRWTCKDTDSWISATTLQSKSPMCLTPACQMPIIKTADHPNHARRQAIVASKTRNLGMPTSTSESYRWLRSMGEHQHHCHGLISTVQLPEPRCHAFNSLLRPWTSPPQPLHGPPRRHRHSCSGKSRLLKMAMN